MSDTTAGQTASTVQATPITQVRLIHTNERPEDALVEITTAKGTQHFLLAKSALPQLAEKLIAFNGQAQGKMN